MFDCFLIVNNMSDNVSLMRMEVEVSAILAMLQELKEQTVGKVYNTQELCEYLKVGKAVIDKLRQDGELEFSKLGRTIVYTQRDIEKLLEKNHFSFVV
jgi:excisionase family DNA binding protein